MKNFYWAFLTVLTSVALSDATVDLTQVECYHYTDKAADADMYVHFEAGADANTIKTNVSVLTNINNEANWFNVYSGDTQVSWADNSVTLDSGDTLVKYLITLPLTAEMPSEPNAGLVFEETREFSNFYCTLTKQE